jgi:thioredoxin-like negative regulator of GroEL
MKEKIVTIFRTKQCQQGKKIREALQHEDIDQETVQVVFINDSPEMSTFFGIKVSPTVLLFEDGEETERHEGHVTPDIPFNFLIN